MKIIVCILPGSRHAVHELAMRLREHGVTPEMLVVALNQGPTQEESMAKLIKELTPQRFVEATKSERSTSQIHPKRKAGRKGNDPHAVTKHRIPERPRNPRRR